MKALQIVEPHMIKIIEKEKPVLSKGDDVIIKVMAAGICGSDIHIYHGTNPMATYPRVIGHECVGVVDEIGSAVTALKKGDRVILDPIEFCGTCYACRNGRGNVCESLVVRGVHADGGFQEYLLADEDRFHKIPDSVTFEQAVMIEPYTIGYQSNSRGDVRDGDVVLIYGAGPAGLIALDVAKEKNITAISVDLNPDRLKLAKEFGADYTINPKDVNVIEKVYELTDNMGANVVFDAVGNGAIFADAIKVASVAGRVVSMGFVTTPAPISIVDITKKELEIHGTRLQKDKFKVAAANIASKLEKIDKLITHTFPFDKYEEAFKLATSGQEGVGKIIVTIGK